MKTDFLKIAGVNTEQEFYELYKSENDFFNAFPNARHMRKGGQLPKAQDGYKGTMVSDGTQTPRFEDPYIRAARLSQSDKLAEQDYTNEQLAIKQNEDKTRLRIRQQNEFNKSRGVQQPLYDENYEVRSDIESKEYQKQLEENTNAAMFEIGTSLIPVAGLTKVAGKLIGKGLKKFIGKPKLDPWGNPILSEADRAFGQIQKEQLRYINRRDHAKNLRNPKATLNSKDYDIREGREFRRNEQTGKMEKVSWEKHIKRFEDERDMLKNRMDAFEKLYPNKLNSSHIENIKLNADLGNPIYKGEIGNPYNSYKGQRPDWHSGSGQYNVNEQMNRMIQSAPYGLDRYVKNPEAIKKLWGHPKGRDYTQKYLTAQSLGYNAEGRSIYNYQNLINTDLGPNYLTPYTGKQAMGSFQPNKFGGEPCIDCEQNYRDGGELDKYQGAGQVIKPVPPQKEIFDPTKYETQEEIIQRYMNDGWRNANPAYIEHYDGTETDTINTQWLMDPNQDFEKPRRVVGISHGPLAQHGGSPYIYNTYPMMNKEFTKKQDGGTRKKEPVVLTSIDKAVEDKKKRLYEFIMPNIARVQMQQNQQMEMEQQMQGQQMQQMPDMQSEIMARYGGYLPKAQGGWHIPGSPGQPSAWNQNPYSSEWETISQSENYNPSFSGPRTTAEENNPFYTQDDRDQLKSFSEKVKNIEILDQSHVPDGNPISRSKKYRDPFIANMVNPISQQPTSNSIINDKPFAWENPGQNTNQNIGCSDKDKTTPGHKCYDPMYMGQSTPMGTFDNQGKQLTDPYGEMPTVSPFLTSTYEPFPEQGTMNLPPANTTIALNTEFNTDLASQTPQVPQTIMSGNQRTDEPCNDENNLDPNSPCYNKLYAPDKYEATKQTPKPEKWRPSGIDYANIMIGGMQTAKNLINRGKEKKQNTSGDNVMASMSEINEGDHDRNSGKLRPNEYDPAKNQAFNYGNVGNYNRSISQMGGNPNPFNRWNGYKYLDGGMISYNIGDELELTEEDIDEIYRNGGSVEYL